MLCIFLCFALGIANIFEFTLLTIFSVICLHVSLSCPNGALSNKLRRVSCFLIIFVEVPLLLRICPTSSKFDTFMRGFSTNPMRALFYCAMAIAQWLSLIIDRSTLIVPAVFLTITGAFYGLAAVTGQEFTGSKTLGGQGVAQMIV